MPQTSRIYAIDVLKTIAMLGVIALHTTGQNVENFVCITDSDILYKTSVISIPLFFMVSGYLQLGKGISYRYSAKKIWRIIKYVFCIELFFGLIDYCRLGWSFHDIMNQYPYGLIGGGKFWIFWFLGAMIILYLFLPFLNKLYSNYRAFLFFVITLFVIECCVFAMNIIDGFENNILQVFRIWNWLIYFCIGGYIKLRKEKLRCSIWIVLILMFVSYISQVFFVYYTGLVPCEFCYSSPITMAFAFSVFVYVLRKYEKDRMLFVIAVSPLFLPVYTFHPFVIEWMPFFIPAISYITRLGLLYWLTISIATILISWCIMRIPYSKNFFKF